MRLLLLFASLFFIPLASLQAEEENVYAPMLRDRILGDDNAPVTIVDYSSLTCPHCAHLHSGALKKIKTDLIDTGKAKLVFRDYPLNAPALQASLVARCLSDDETYFQYIDFLFETQESWAQLPDVRPYLAQNARLLGISSDDLDSCMSKDGYQDAFIAKVQTIREGEQIESTPTLVIEETGEKIAGNKPYMVYETAVNNALKEAKEAKEEEQ